ncbi:hypothetical protein [Halomicronema sp. CCY15110]|nr:hypothetical protein [Halomicronema sp. CCY15110]
MNKSVNEVLAQYLREVLSDAAGIVHTRPKKSVAIANFGDDCSG